MGGLNDVFLERTLSGEKYILPSFPLAGERVVERSNDRVSQTAVHDRQCIGANVLRVDSPQLRFAG